ncbi:MAG: DnaJ domain-containing protein, partial [Anaerolineae bacterium]|nr:DnaJ domain-containing protein [Anaerolineae bacterium]
MTDEQQQDRDTLRGNVATWEREVAKLETEIAELEREIEDFQGRYQQNVGFAEARLDGAKELLSQLERERAQAYNPVASSGYMSVEEQFRQRWRRPVDEPPPAPEKPQTLPETLSPADLKQMYRKLARLYHPDFAADEADRQRRTRLMALINEAYEAGDLQALRILEKGVPEDRQMDVRQIQTDQSLAMLELHQLRQA